MTWFYLIGLIILICLGSWGWVSRAKWLDEQVDKKNKNR
ncbi:hypothetical protein IGJ68_002133 [Enterococcus sp. DIV0564]